MGPNHDFMKSKHSFGLEYIAKVSTKYFLALVCVYRSAFSCQLAPGLLKISISFRLGTKRGPWEMVWVNSQQESE